MDWLENEDPELLRAALEIIDAWDGESTVRDKAVGSPTCSDDTESTNDENDGENEIESGDDAHSSPSPTASDTHTKPLPHVNVKEKVPPRTTAARGASRELKPSTLTSTRHRRGEEILCLRDELKALEAQLMAIRSSIYPHNDVDQAMAVAWQTIAARQSRHRQMAELEHIKLKNLVENHVQVARGLMKLIQKARRIEVRGAA
jgi:hypothetical protein